MAEPRPDPIEQGFFRPAPEGGFLFFPFGLGRRAYRLPDERAKRRAARGVSCLLVACLAIAGWAAQAILPLAEGDAPPALAELWSALAAPVVALAGAFALYALWVARFVEPFPESDLRVSREERLAEAARHSEPLGIAIAGAAIAAASAALLWLRPAASWVGVLGIALGAGLAAVGVALLRKRSALGRRAP